MARVDDMFHKMMRRFDNSDKHNKELRSDLAGIGKKVDTYEISITQLEFANDPIICDSEHMATGHSS